MEEKTTQQLEKEEVKITLGEVINCSKLNVREKPSKQAKVRCLVSVGDILQIEPVNTDWFEVTTPSGITGYCRKEFIRVK